jgi:hypothetical protein
MGPILRELEDRALFHRESASFLTRIIAVLRFGANPRAQND